MKQYQNVMVVEDITDEVVKGMRGIIVEVWREGEAYEVEFFDGDRTVDVLTVYENQLLEVV